MTTQTTFGARGLDLDQALRGAFKGARLLEEVPHKPTPHTGGNVVTILPPEWFPVLHTPNEVRKLARQHESGAMEDAQDSWSKSKLADKLAWLKTFNALSDVENLLQGAGHLTCDVTYIEPCKPELPSSFVQEMLTAGFCLHSNVGVRMLSAVDYAGLVRQSKTGTLRAQHSMIDPTLADDIEFLLERIKSLPVETPAPPPTFREIPVRKSDLSMAHDLSVPLPSAWGEYSNPRVLSLPVPWAEFSEWCKSLKKIPRQENRVLHLTQRETLDAWERFCFRNNFVQEGYQAVELVPLEDRMVRWTPKCAVDGEVVWLDKNRTLKLRLYKSDPNYECSDRMTAPATKGVIPSANTSSKVWFPISRFALPRFNHELIKVDDCVIENVYPVSGCMPTYEHAPVPKFDYQSTMSDEEIQAEPERIAMIDAKRNAAVQDEQVVGDSENLDPAYWEGLLEEELSKDYEKTQAKAKNLWNECHQEATNGELSEWLGELVKDKKVFMPYQKPDHFTEIHGLKTQRPKRLSNTEMENEAEMYDKADAREDRWQNPTTTYVTDNGYTAASDDEGQDGNDTDGINYDGVTQATEFTDLGQLRENLAKKYRRMGIDCMTHEEQKAYVTSHRDFGTNIVRYVVETENRKIIDMYSPKSYSAARAELHRADKRTEAADVDFDLAIKNMSNQEVAAVLQGGGTFFVVVLQGKYHLKRLGDVDMPEPDCEDAFEGIMQESVRKAVNHAKRVAVAQKLGKKATEKAVAEAQARIEEAYSRVLLFRRVEYRKCTQEDCQVCKA